MATTRGKTKDIEASTSNDGNIGQTELDLKKSTLQSTYRKLSYFNKSTKVVLETGNREQTSRQRSVIGSKRDDVYSLIQDIQELFIDQEQPEEFIDNWTAETKASLLPFETSNADKIFESTYEKQVNK